MRASRRVVSPFRRGPAPSAPQRGALAHGARGGSAGAAPDAARARGLGAGPLGRGLVVGPAGAARLRVPPAAGGQHAARAARPGAPRGRCPPQGAAQTRAAAGARAGARPGLGGPHPPGNPGAGFRAAGGGRRAPAVPGQGRARVPPLARGRLASCALARGDPGAAAGRPPCQERSQGGEAAPRFAGVAHAQPVLTAAEADPHPLEVSGAARAEGEPRAAGPAGPCLGLPPRGLLQPAARARPASQLASVSPQLVSEHCPRLTFLKLSDCHGVTADALVTLARACPQLHSLDLQHSVVESAAVVSFLEEAGPRMRRLWLTYSSQTTAILGALLGSCCPQLQVLEVSTGISPNSTPLQLPVEALQTGCPQLQVLRLLNLVWLPKPSARGAAPGPGFPGLEELCLASSTCNFVSNAVLGRLLHGSPNLRLLDLRGCARITPAGLHDLPCQELEQLHLGLYGLSDRLTLAKEGSPLLTHKWCHTLRELDLSGQGFSENDLERALAAFAGTPGGPHPALCSLNLRGTRVTPSTVSAVISSCPGLLYLNLESCRCLPRGLKRAYRGQAEVQWCLEQLLTSAPPPS